MCTYCRNAKCKDREMQKYRNVKWRNAKRLGTGWRSFWWNPLFCSTTNICFSWWAALLVFVVMYTVNAKSKAHPIDQVLAARYSYSKYSWSITCYPGHYCLRSCSSPSCWRLCLSGSGRSPCGVIAIIIIIIILIIVLSSIHKWITIFSNTFSIHSHDSPCYCVRLICCSRFAGIEADNILI